MDMTFSKGVISYDVDGVFYHKSFTPGGISAIPHGKVDSSISKGTDGTERIQVTLIPDKNTECMMHSCSLYGRYSGSVESVFVNGYQSWSESREFRPDQTQKKMSTIFNHWIRKYHLRTYGDEHMQAVSATEGVFHSYSWTYLRESAKAMTFLGSVSEQYGFTIFQTDTRDANLVILKECEGSRISQRTELISCVSLHGDYHSCFERWAAYWKRNPLKISLATGWTSWYNYYEKITEDIILDNLKEFGKREIPIDCFQIDDGWQKAVGDWLLIKDTFPSGMKYVAQEIRKAGYGPGLWLAPFVAEESSVICEKHAHWLVRDEQGSFVIAGYNPFNWSGNFYVLDIYQHEVREYLREVFKTIIQDWGFEMVKLDFLYAAAIIPRKGRSRGQIMYESMKFLREICGPLKILGCGVPLGSAFGFVDYCRIGSDVSLGWEDLRLKAIRYKERVSTCNSLTSTLGRAGINDQFFGNDPDVFILREENTSLQEVQKKTLFLLNNLLGSLVFTSDNIGEYSEETLNEYLSLFPLRKKQVRSITEDKGFYRIEVSIGERVYCVLANMTSKQRTGKVPGSGSYWFENSVGDEFQIHEPAAEIPVKAYGSVCLYRAEDVPWGIIGTTRRLFPASEIHSHYVIDERDGFTRNMYIELESHIPRKGMVFIRIPEDTETHQIYLHGQQADILQVRGHRIARFSMEHLYDS